MAISNSASLEFKGLDAYLEDALRQTMGFANLWTIGIWIKPFEEQPVPFSIDNKALFHLQSMARENEILIWADRITDTNEDTIHVELWDKDGQQFRVSRFNMAQKRKNWRHFSIYWSGENLIAWNGGIQIADFHEVLSNSGIMEDSARSIRLGAAYSGTATHPQIPLSTWSGLLGATTVWNTTVTGAQLDEVVSGTFGFDLLTNSGSYTSSANLQHWWRLGRDDTDVGEDSGNAALLFDVNTDGVNASGVVIDAP